VNPVAEAVWRKLAPRETAAGFVDYLDAPVLFAREVLGVEPWSKQAELLDAIGRYDRVTVRSGHRVSKTNSAAIAALWFLATRGPGARVVMTGPSAHILTQGLWREVRMLHSRNKAKLGGEAAVLPSTGIRWEDDRQVVGLTADEPEAFQGIAGAEMLFIVDEASGVHDRIFEALMGNLAGGARLLMISNPTRAAGFFFDSHKSPRYHAVHISSEDSPNVTGERTVPGLATSGWLAECAHLWGGTDSVLYRIRCKGDFAEGAGGKLFPADAIDAAVARHISTPSTGRLAIGIDPAGEGGEGDASGFAARRGLLVVHVGSRRGLSADGHVAEVLGLIKQFGQGATERPVVLIDRDGLVGHRVWMALSAHLSTNPDDFDLIGVRGSEWAHRRPLEVHLVRDEMWFELEASYKRGLAVPSHAELEGDLGAVRKAEPIKGRDRVTSKKEMRRELGRSPDLGDALALCCYAGDIRRAYEVMAGSHARAEPFPHARGARQNEMPVRVLSEAYGVKRGGSADYGMRRR
jgi:hypothetical protein